jgi:hypothetical protein
MRFQLEIKSRGAGKHRQNAEEVLRQLELPWKLSGIKTGSKGTTLSYLLEVGDESKLDRLSEDLQAGRGARGKKDISVRLVRQ